MKRGEVWRVNFGGELNPAEMRQVERALKIQLGLS